MAAVEPCQEPVDEVGERLYGVACVRWAADQRVLHEHVDRVEAAGAEQHAAVAVGHSLWGVPRPGASWATAFAYSHLVTASGYYLDYGNSVSLARVVTI